MPENGLVTAGADPGAARGALVLLHGRGQSPEVMLDAVVSRLSVPGLHVVLPAAPGGSWYDAKAVEPMTDRTGAQLAASLALVAEAEAAARQSVPDRPLVLVGFSQGACMVIEHLMHGGRADAAAMLTGCRVGAVQDDLPRADLAGLPVYCSNGDDDPWIPTRAFQAAVGHLIESGARVRSDVFPGRPHEVSQAEIAALDALCAAMADGTAPFGDAA
ncbi:phospholipase/carboxylesterase [Wenxinia marina]|uniref:alpha/beta hydrolase n=1 Tax=Wenxinia marina TaxID=390641 RepID=UPI00036C7228|nr:dienelactone hydrolase family protein [Wenxinia marina]GGL58044.1 phospholipase/carboxylesterase [Wenxinia marina]